MLQKRGAQEPVDHMGSLQLLDQEEEKVPHVNLAPKASNKIFCSKCEASFEYCELGDKVIYIDECLHAICKSCLTKEIDATYPDVKCMHPGCKVNILDMEVRAILGDKAYEDLQTKMTLKLLDQQNGIVRCKCGNAIEFMKGDIDYNYKNDEGKNINKAAAKHMSTNRVRCNECGNNFCIGCKAEPYHVGKTCA